MGRPVSLFSGYSQKENRVTNYTLLILKMLYEENPKYLGEVLAAIVGEDISSHVGITFRQQERQTASTPDGLITQRALTVYIETKNYDWFYDEQLKNHLRSFNNKSDGLKVLLALGNFESENQERFKRVRSICEKEYKNSIWFQAITFEDLLNKVQISGLSKNLADAIADFKDFLNEENLLQTWRDWLDVVNCAGIPEDVTKGGVYMCPAEGRAYTHDRCRFFGMYRNKRVELIGEIEAVVDVDRQADTTVIKWKNVAEGYSKFKRLAKEKIAELRPDAGPTRVFLLGPLFKTDFQKDSRGGMIGSKQYFPIVKFQADDAKQLAEKLNGLKWSEVSGVK